MSDSIKDLFPFYALGALTEQERRQVESYLQANPEERPELEEMIQTAGVLGFAVEPAPPPERLKQALMDRVRADTARRPARRPAAPSTRGPSWAALAFAALSLIAALASGIWALSLSDQVARLQTENTILLARLTEQERVLAELSAPDSLVAAVTGTEHQPQAAGRLIASPGRRDGVLLVSGLAPLPEDQSYQVWLIAGDQPASAGLFRVDEHGRALIEISAADPIGQFEALGVSIEPAGGSDQPTGAIVILSTLPF